MHMCYKFFYTTWALGVACQKTTVKTKIGGGSGLGEHPKNLGPLHISATVEASNFKLSTQLGFGISLPKKQQFGPKLVGVWARGASEKMWDPLRIFAIVEASNFKFGTQIVWD